MSVKINFEKKFEKTLVGGFISRLMQMARQPGLVGRLTAFLLIASILLPAVSFGFSRANPLIERKFFINPTDSAARKFWSFQQEQLEKAGALLKSNNRQTSESAENTQTSQDKESSKPETETNKQHENQPTAKVTLEKPKSIKRQSYSAVKNLPDAARLRQTPAAMPQIPAPIPSKACLISTVNCPSDKNREVAAKSPKGNALTDNSLSSIISSYSALSANNYLFDNLLAFNKNNPLSSAKISTPEIKSAPASDASQNHNFFSNFEVYNPATPASYTASANALMLPPGGNGKIFDFDGDDKADMSFWRPDTGAWFVLRSSDSSYMTQTDFGWGSSGDRIAPGNYDGDMKTDYAYWRPSSGVWTIKQSTNNQTVTYTLGQSGDLPVPGDYDGDGKTDAAVWRPSGGIWLYRKSSDGTTQSYNWGLSTDVPVVGDFDGDNKTDFAVVRSSDTHWYIMQSSNGWFQVQWGTVGDRLVPGDYDGDGKTDVGVWRASDNTWYIRKSSTGVLQALTWGIAADYPVPADYDGDDKTDMAIWRNSNGQWWVTQSSNGSQYGVTFGATGDIPIPVSYVAYLSSSNQSPTAEAGGPYTAATGTAARFDGRGSTDTDGQVYGYNWNFGDGSTGTGSRPSHSYSTAGTYTVSLTVTDNRGAVSTADTATVTVINSAQARLDPFNAVGGTNVISKNFGWGIGLASLPGRAEMGAGIGLSYNSLVWLKQGNYMIFDPDNGFPGPGFRLGMATIERRHYNPQTGKNGFLMLTESGSRVEFRQIGTSTTYETADSSYTQLIDNGTSLLVRTTDGTQYTYEPIGQGYECVRVKDRNGNFIEAAYNSSGRLTQITDTLGRALVVNYDGNGNPLSIAQSYNGSQPRVYATFGYASEPINTSFSTGLTVIGPANNTQITVLKQVAFDDGSYYRFTYNSYGQIYQIDQHAKDNLILNHVKYPNLASPGAQPDCPRFTSREDYAKNWTTATTQYPVATAATWTMHDSAQSESGLMSEVIAPDGTKSRYFYHSAGWDKGVPIRTETHGADKPGDPLELQRWSTVRLTQSNTGLSYLENPRVTSSAVGDAGNTRKSSTGYTTYTLPSGTQMYLPNDSTEYGSNGTITYRHAQTDYELNTNYINSNRYIVGLVKEIRLYAGAGTGSLQAKTEIVYDGEALTNLSGIIRHDTTNYGTSFQWRGNPTSVKRWDIVNTTQSITSKIGYTIAGTQAWTQSPTQTATNRVSVSYTDNFSNAADNRNSYAYPTTVTDPDGYTAISKYHYLSGLVDTAQGPKAGQTNIGVWGAINKTHYDSIDRVQKVETLKSDGTATGAYTRYEYLDSMTEAKTYTKLDGSLTEAYQLAVVDGHGRTRATATDLPGSFGGYSGRTFEYDNMGRNWKSSIPTETSASGGFSGWAVTGDDDPNNQSAPGYGWLYTTESFDWKGRVVRRINSDSNGADGKDQLFEYAGCGCAGNQITTVKSEQVNGTDRRTQKIHQDWLGRTSKTEVLNWNASVYSTVVNNFNTRDQITDSIQYAGAQGSSTSQTTLLTYDEYGRLKTQKRPEQTSPTTYNYRQDDSISSFVDARGATTGYTYNNRGLVTLIDYQSPSGVPDTPDISFTYDAAGNRTQMNDGPGVVDYAYNELAQMTSETRRFDESLPDAPQSNNGYQIQYTYYSGGQLKSLTEPWGVTVNYNLDKIGRLTSVTPTTAYGTTTAFATNAQYRAWGAVKHLEYGDGMQMNQTFNDRQQALTYQLADSQQQVMNKFYMYYSDGSLRYIHDFLNSIHDRLNVYDHLGRIKEAKSSLEANGQTIPDGWNQTQTLPYRQSYQYNEFGDMTERYNKLWGADVNLTRTYSYTNHRVNAWQYDADGRVTTSSELGIGNSAISYNATGQLNFKHDYTALTIKENKLYRFYDGDGREVKRTTSNCRMTEPNQEECQWSGDVTGYYIRSTVLGGETIAEAVMGGGKGLRYVRAGNGILAHLRENYVWQQGGGYSYDAAYYEHRDSSGMSFRMTKRLMPFGYGDYTDERKAEFDSGASNVGLVSTYNPGPGEPPENPIPLESDSPLMIDGQQVTATVDGVAMSWMVVRSMAQAGALAVNLTSADGRTVRQSPVQATVGGLYYVNSLTTSQPIEGPAQVVSYDMSGIYFGIPFRQTQQTRNTVSSVSSASITEKCADVVSLGGTDTEKGALARLLFAEATGIETLRANLGYRKIPDGTYSQTEWKKRIQKQKQSLAQAENSAIIERRAIAAIVYNRANYLNNSPTDRRGWGEIGDSVLDIIYSANSAGTQFQGFTTSANGQFSISGGALTRINNALDSPANSSTCADLRKSIEVANNFRPNQDPFATWDRFGTTATPQTYWMRTAGSRPPVRSASLLGTIPGSGNSFYSF